jgi:hypothetical protein
VNAATTPAPGSAGARDAGARATRTATDVCPLCGAALLAEQDWCLRCGAAARTRLAAAPDWKIPVVALAVVVVLSLGVLTAALVKLAGNSTSPATATTAAAVTPAPVAPAAVAPAAATPTTATAPTAAAPGAVQPGGTAAPGGLGSAPANRVRQPTGTGARGLGSTGPSVPARTQGRASPSR